MCLPAYKHVGHHLLHKLHHICLHIYKQFSHHLLHKLHCKGTDIIIMDQIVTISVQMHLMITISSPCIGKVKNANENTDTHEMSGWLNNISMRL